MTDRVAIVGVGQSGYAARMLDKHITELVYEVVRDTVGPLGLTPLTIDNIVSCSQDFIDGRTISNRTTAEAEGAYLKSETKVAGDGVQAVFYALMRILSGKYQTCLVVAHAKMSEGAPNVISNAMFDPLYQKATGIDELGAAALAMRRYLHATGASEEHCARAAAKNLTNAARNPAAFRGKKTSAADVMNSPMLASPIRELMAMAPADGACALVLASEAAARKLTDKPVWITGAGSAIDAYYLGDRDLGKCESLTLSAQKAYKMAGITDPKKQIDVAEICDFYSYQELLWSEGLGLADPGKGAALLESGKSEMTGAQPINPSGGALGGAPLCVAGLARVIECFLQLRGQAGEHQIGQAKTAVAQGSNGPCGQLQCVVTLSRE